MEFLERIEKTSYRNGKSSIEISENIKLKFEQTIFPIRNLSPFYGIFNKMIQQLVETGFCPHRLLGKTLSSKTKNKMFDEEIPALVLSMDDLGVGFEICLIPLSLSLTVFIFEVFYSKAKQKVQEYLTAVFAVLTFIKDLKY